MTDYTTVSARAVLVSLQLSTWSARKFDRKATAEVNDANRATADAGRYNKHLLAGAKEHRALLLLAGAARQLHYDETLPWSNEGWRLLPTANYFAYTDKMRKERAKFDTLLSDFLDAYPDLRRAARVTLGDMYDEKDFPDVHVIASRFDWTTEFEPVPTSGDLRVDLPGDQIEAIEARVKDRVEQAARAAMKDAWERLREAVQRIQRASREDGIVRGNLMDHAREVTDVLARLNVADDRDLEAMRQRVQRELTGISPDDLRKDDVLRQDTERRATDIMAAMSAFYTPTAVTAAA